MSTNDYHLQRIADAVLAAISDAQTDDECTLTPEQLQAEFAAQAELVLEDDPDAG